MTNIFTRFEMQTDDARAALKALRKAVNDPMIEQADENALHEVISALEEALGE